MNDDGLILGSQDTWPVAGKGGPLVKVQVAPNVFVRMREEDAVKQGLIKAQEPPENKMREPAQNKRRGRPRKAVGDG